MEALLLVATEPPAAIPSRPHRRSPAVCHGPGLDQPLGFLLDQEGDCNFLTSAGFIEPAVMLQSDGLGSVTTLLNQTRGFFRSPFLAERVTYDAFGTPTFQHPGPDGLLDTGDDLITDRSAFGSPYAFTGREWDPESGLYYYRARYYDPRMGRFLQEDPLRAYSGSNYYLYAGSVRKPLLQSLTETNVYLYTGNNPVNFTDPFGLWKFYGNWGGPKWTNGTDKWTENEDFPREGEPGFVAPINERDRAYYQHDTELRDCAKVEDTDVRQQCRRRCDVNLSENLSNLKGKYGNTSIEEKIFRAKKSPNNNPGNYHP